MIILVTLDYSNLEQKIMTTAKRKNKSNKSTKSTNSSTGIKKGVWFALAVIVAIGGWFAYKTFADNVSNDFKDGYLYIKTGSTYDDVIATLQKEKILNNISSFELLAKQAGLEKKIKPGKYKINKNTSNYDLVRMLRNGQQEPVKLVINKFRTQDDIIKFVGSKVEADTQMLRKLMNDNNYLSQFGLNSNTSVNVFLPDTYEVWWNTSSTELFEKLAGYYKKYWNEERRAQAQALNLTIPQVITIASIVEEETNKNDEKSTVASVYINRLNKGMKLQADPTVKFALNDFAIKRVTGAHTSFASPYNTYQNVGLPPGPICTPSQKSIEAVLNAKKTAYIYFCAKEDFSGYHSFAKDYDEHMQNARRYHKALNDRNIK